MIILRHGILASSKKVTGAPGPSYPTDSLIARYTFDNASNRYEDSYGSYDLTGYNSPQFGSGGIGGTYFDANGTQYMQRASFYDFSGLSGVSYSFWINYSRARDGLHVFRADNAFTVQTRGGYGSNSRVGTYFWIGGSFKTKLTSWASYEDSWTHVVATYDGTTIRQYINNGTPLTTSASGTIGPAATSSLYLNTSSSGNQSGIPVDQIYFYAKTLSASEVSQLYNSGSGV